MSELPEALFSNPVWHALRGPHRHLAIVEGSACRYPADVSPFAAIAAPTDRALDELRMLLAPEESVWIVDYGRTVTGLKVVDALDCVQMVLPADVEPAPAVGRGTTAHRREFARDGRAHRRGVSGIFSFQDVPHGVLLRRPPPQLLTPHAGLERAMPIARPLTIKAPISEAAAAASAP